VDKRSKRLRPPHPLKQRGRFDPANDVDNVA
jgi:hypothetical protein